MFILHGRDVQLGTNWHFSHASPASAELNAASSDTDEVANESKKTRRAEYKTYIVTFGKTRSKYIFLTEFTTVNF